MNTRMQALFVFVFVVAVVVGSLAILPQPHATPVKAEAVVVDAPRHHGHGPEVETAGIRNWVPGGDCHAYEYTGDMPTSDDSWCDYDNGSGVVAIVTEVVRKVRHAVETLTATPTDTITDTPAPTITPAPTLVVTETPKPTDTVVPTVVVTETPAPTQIVTATPNCNNGAGNGDNCTPGHSSGSNQGQGVPTGDQTNQGENGNNH